MPSDERNKEKGLIMKKTSYCLEDKAAVAIFLCVMFGAGIVSVFQKIGNVFRQNQKQR